MADEHTKNKDPTVALSREIGELLGRLRLLEERYANLRREHQVTSHNMIEHHQSITKMQRRLSDAIMQLKRSIKQIKDQILVMQGQLAESAKIHDFKAIETYIDMWQPLNFLTREEATQLIQEALENKKSKQTPKKSLKKVPKPK